MNKIDLLIGLAFCIVFYLIYLYQRRQIIKKFSHEKERMAQDSIQRVSSKHKILGDKMKKVRKWGWEDRLRILSLGLLLVGSVLIGLITAGPGGCHWAVGLGAGTVMFFGFSVPFHIWDEKSQKDLELYVFIWTVIRRRRGI